MFLSFLNRILRKGVRINCYKEHPDAQIPIVAYDNTSAAFDVSAVADVTINPGEAKEVPNGLRLIIEESEPYYMTIHLRSSIGFKKKAIPHSGIVDGGYCGSLGVLVHNFGTEPLVIKKGDRYAQILVHRKPDFYIEEIDSYELKEIEARQKRGDNGFGSSNSSKQQ